MILLLVGIVAGGSFFLLQSAPPVVHVKGKISRAFEEKYGELQAAQINAKGITLILDDKTYVDKNGAILRMSPQMKIMLQGELLNDVFRCSVCWPGDGSVMVYEDTRHDYRGLYEKGQNAVRLALDEDGYVSLEEAAGTFGFSYAWEEDTATVSLESPLYDEEVLPAFFDLRREERVPPVRDQGEMGSCWAFAAVAALESALMPGQNWNFSEENMVSCNRFSTGGAGGDFNMALAYLLSWAGPGMEYEDAYGDAYTPDGLDAAVHVQDAVILNERDLEQVKSLVYHNGAVQCAMYSPSDMDSIQPYYNEEYAAYYYPESRQCSHDMDIIGWDDDFPRECFKIQPSSDGAFICRNSWGEGFGENGYFYISYEDPNIALYGAAYTGIEAPDNFDNIYQMDLLGWTGSIGFDGPKASFAGVYTAEEDEELAGTGFYSTGSRTWYDIYLVHNFSSPQDLQSRELLQSGYLADKGYFTIRMGRREDLAAGEKFAVAVDIYTSGSETPIAIEYAGSDLTQGADISDGESYVSGDGITWSSMEETQDCNACLKVYTEKQ